MTKPCPHVDLLAEKQASGIDALLLQFPVLAAHGVMIHGTLTGSGTIQTHFANSHAPGCWQNFMWVDSNRELYGNTSLSFYFLPAVLIHVIGNAIN